VSAAIGELTPIVGVKAACEALNVPRASFYRKRGLGVFPAAAGSFGGRWIPRSGKRYSLVSTRRGFRLFATRLITASNGQFLRNPRCRIAWLMLSILQSQQPMDPAARRKIVLIQGLGIPLIVALAVLVFASFLTGSLPTWVGILALVAETSAPSVLIKKTVRLRKHEDPSPVPFKRKF
jgi:hypothetical protein